MGKTSKQTTTQQIDPQIRDEIIKNVNAARELAGGGFVPFVGNTIADFSPAQRASFEGTDALAAAFGLPGGAAAGGPSGATAGAYGIEGFSPETVMQAESPLPEDYQETLRRFYELMGGNPDAATAQQNTSQPNTGNWTIKDGVWVQGDGTQEGGYGTTHSGSGAPSFGGFDPFSGNWGM